MFYLRLLVFRDTLTLVVAVQCSYFNLVSSIKNSFKNVNHLFVLSVSQQAGRNPLLVAKMGFFCLVTHQLQRVEIHCSRVKIKTSIGGDFFRNKRKALLHIARVPTHFHQRTILMLNTEACICSKQTRQEYFRCPEINLAKFSKSLNKSFGIEC